MSDQFLFDTPTELKELDKDGRERLNRLYFQCNTLLGGTSIPVHLEETDYAMSFVTAMNLYRSRSSRSINQTFGFMYLESGQGSYQLHERVDVVRRVIRTGGRLSGLGQAFEPFSASTANILLRGAAGGSGNVDLVSYELYAQYQETLSRLFARELNFYFRAEDSTLILHQTPQTRELVMIELSVLKTVSELLRDHFAYQWLQEYTLACAQEILAQKYSLFSVAPGPQGGTTLKGEALRATAAETKTRLENDLMVWADNGDIGIPIRG